MIRGSSKPIEASALLLRKTDYGDSDLVLQLLTDTLGCIGAMARTARVSKKRFSGGLEPFHGLRVTIDATESGTLHRLRESRIEIARSNLVSSWVALDIAGRALAWVRDTTAVEAQEPEIYGICTRFLDTLDAAPPSVELDAEARLAEFGLTLLASLGWALELERCVRCGRHCPPTSRATVDPKRGGIVCRNCGGALIHVDADLRLRMRDSSRGCATLAPSDARLVLAIVEAALAAHPGVGGR